MAVVTDHIVIEYIYGDTIEERKPELVINISKGMCLDQARLLLGMAIENLTMEAIGAGGAKDSRAKLVVVKGGKEGGNNDG